MSVLTAVGKVTAIAAAAVRGWVQGWRGAEPPPDAAQPAKLWTTLEEQRRQIRDATTLYKVPPKRTAMDDAIRRAGLGTLEASIAAAPRCANCGTLAAVCRAVQADTAELCCAFCACAGRK